MLEVEEPGELPLMKELTSARKKSKAAQNLWRRKPPLFESLSSSNHNHDAACMQPLESEGRQPNATRDVRDIHANVYSQQYFAHGERDGSHAGNTHISDAVPRGASSRSAKSPQSIQHFDPTSMRFPPMNDLNAKIMNWDAMGDGTTQHGAGSGKSLAENLQRESLQNHLERLGILGGGQTSTAHPVGEASLLHNWKSVDDGGASHANHHENLELERSPHAWNQYESMRGNPITKSHSGNFFAYKHDQDAGLDASISKEFGRRPNALTLSPLVLNPRDDIHRFGQYGNQPHFCLEEEPSYELDDGQEQPQHDNKERLWRGMNGESWAPRSPLQPHRKQTTNKSSRSLEIRSPPFGFRPGTSETEFLEYDVETLEQPSKRRELRPMYRMQSSKEHNSQTQEQHAGYSLDSRRPIRRPNASGYEGRPSLQRHNQPKAAYTYNRRAQMEPLPLLTELEDYNGSDEYDETSIDGDFRSRFSMNEHQEELRVASSRGYGADGHGHVETGGIDRLQLAVRECKELALCESHPRNLSQKYRPKAFEEVVGQPIVTQALSNAIERGRIAPVYLFQGSRGTGKTTAARIFASALVCISPEGQRPCGVCRECASVAKGINSEVKEVDAASNNGIERVKVLLEETISAPPLSRYKVFIIDECHVLTVETWNALLKILEEPPMNVVFILITTDADRLPRTALSRCQKFPFSKIKDSEIIERLQKLASMEKLSIDSEILKLIASRSDGSLRDAETTLDQVTLLGHQVDTSMVHELVGCASDDRILSLLDAALVADTINTVKRARDLIDSGMEPLSLMSRLATLITDILAGSFKFAESQRKGFFRKQALSDDKLERLRMAMKILAEAEKQLRASNDRTTWLTAALLQLGPDRMCMFSASCTGTSVTQSPIALDDMGEHEANDFEPRSADRCTMSEQGFMETEASHQPSYHGSEKSRLDDDPLDISFKDTTNEQRLSPTKLDDIWSKVMQKCRPLPLRQLLNTSVMLTSISITEVDATAHLEVCNPAQKSSCERSQKSIAHLFELVLGFPVEIKTSLASLPAEGGPVRSTQVSVSRNEGESGKHVHIHPEAAAHSGYEKRKPESVNKPNSSYQLNIMESFPAIPSPSPQHQRYGASTWNTAGVMHVSSLVEGATKSSATEGVLTNPSGAATNPTTHGQYRTAGLGDSHGYIQEECSFEDIDSEEERIMDETRAISPNPFEVDGLHDKSRLRPRGHDDPGSIQSKYHQDAHPSHFHDERKPTGGNMKMVQRLSIRSQTLSTRKSDPNSPSERGSYLRVPRFSMKAQKDPERHKIPISPQEPSKQTANLDEGLATQKRGKLKSSFARFFQGKLNK